MGCRRTTTPKTRVSFWLSKFEANVARDVRAEQALANLGWQVLIVWECETADLGALKSKLGVFLHEAKEQP